MSYPSCAQCGALLFPSDEGTCPHCQWDAAGAIEHHDDTTGIDPVEHRPGPPPVDDAYVLLEPAGVRPEGAFAPGEEALYQEARRELVSPAAPQRGGLGVLGLSLVAFVAVNGESSWKTVAILIGVIFLHELGHWAGMRWFGYNDLKIFFIPFFGGAASGRKDGAPQWQQAIVLLLGPLPGIVLGCAVLWANVWLRSRLALLIGAWLVGVNAFNLLPLMPLDGGRLLNLLVFSRHRVLEAVFLAATALGLIGIGALLGSTILVGIGVLGLLMTPGQYRSARRAVAFRERWPGLPARAADAGDARLRELFRAVRAGAKFQARNAGKLYANQMRSVYERAAVRPVSVGAIIGLLAVYGAGFALSFAGAAAVALAHPIRNALRH